MRADAPEGGEVRPAVAADLIERHDDHACGPGGRSEGESGIGDEPSAAMIEREDRLQAVCFRLGDRAGVAQGFRAEDGYEPRPGGVGRGAGGVDALEHRAHRAVVGEAAVEPDFGRRQFRAQGGERGGVIAVPEDGVEIGDIKRARAARLEECACERNRFARRGEPRAQRAIVGALAAYGAYGFTAEQVEYRYDQHEVRPLTKIFVYEYLTGGGIDPELAGDGSLADLSALMGDGRVMRDSLVSELRKLGGVRVSFASSRFEALSLQDGSCCPVPGESIPAFVARVARTHDYAWVIAPECDDLLLQLHDAVGPQRWLGCTREAIALASSKRATVACLAAHGIAVTESLDPASEGEPGEGPWVVKPDDGAGSLDTFVFDSYAAACADYDTRASAGRAPVLQRWVEGEPLSLSLICREEGVELVSVNRQRIGFVERHAPGAHMRIVEWGGVAVDQMDLGSVRGQTLASLARRTAAALPGLRGFIGIDLVWHPRRGPVIVEINPRLTTAYAHLAASSGGRLTRALLAAHGVPLAEERAPRAASVWERPERGAQL